MKRPIYLGVNIDHVATLRQMRGTAYPDPIKAAILAVDAGADGITLHLREDRRHIQDKDVFDLREKLSVPMNLEMAATQEMVAIAKKVRPEKCCLVPEKRAELTTEGGLDVVGQKAYLTDVCAELSAMGIEVSLFIDPNSAQIDASKMCGAPVIEIHTGAYAEAEDSSLRDQLLSGIISAAQYADKLGLIVNAGHGLHYQNTQKIAAIPVINELNIGHSIVAYALFVGMSEAVSEMKELMLQARNLAK